VEENRAAQDSACFEAYVAMRGTALTRFAFLLLGDHHLAQDLTQEALAKLHRHWSRVSDFDDLDAYVRKMMLNQLLSWRRRKSWTERTIEAPEDHAGDHDLASDRVERDAMWTLLGELPPQQRAVIVLRYYEDLDDDRIADLLGCSAPTVRSHASKATTRLRAVVTDANLTPGGHRG
jgi:RNA polymerase sigma-70 factor (sigma-E family)